jgi:hypothetical protein
VRNALLILGLVCAGCGDGGGVAPVKDAGIGCAGQLGCDCDPTGRCAMGAFCDSSRKCSAPKTGCTPGELECGCAGGGCNSGLHCLEDVCRDNTGFEGGTCLPDNQCHTGNRCAAGVCLACSPGTQGCTCSTSGCNDTLACDHGMCVTGTGFAANTPSPAGPTSCVTPCSGGLVAPDGSYVACPADGIMPGCLPGLSCDHGQCLCPGSAAKTCTADVDCADFHACLDGYCRTNCEGAGDCRSDASCYRHVCRKSCDVSKTGACPEGLICYPFDGQNGVCLMRAEQPLASPPPDAAQLALPLPALRFTPSNTTGKLDIQNTSSFDAVVVLRKLRQREPNPMTKDPITLELLARETAPAVDSNNCATGSRGCRCGSDSARPCNELEPGFAMSCESGVCQLRSCQAGTIGCACDGADCRVLCEAGRCPLEFVSLAVDVGINHVVPVTKDQIVTFTLPANQTASLTVSAPERGPWDGAIEVEPRGKGGERQEVAVSYANTPEGRWVGEMHYFGDFSVSDTGLDTWRANRGAVTNDASFDAEVSGIRNAFLEKWANFRRGRIDFRTLLAVLVATRSESWRSPTLTQICGPHGWICYPDDNPDGYGVYTFTQDNSPVPAGVLQMPFAMQLSPVAADPLSFGGVVDGGYALQYPGAPAVAAKFAADPAACKPGADGNCITFFDSFAMSSVVGGRYDGAGCSARYGATVIPWLVPGFAGRSALDANGLRYLHECRELRAPLAGGDDASHRQNSDFSSANPILDGRERTRTLELIDGLVVNGDTMLILFREKTPPLVGFASSGVTAYGFISLKRDDTPGSAPLPSPVPVLPTPPPQAAPANGCGTAGDVLARVAQADGSTVPTLLNGGNWPKVAHALLDGTLVGDATPMITGPSPAPWIVTGGNNEQVHYLCADTKKFEGAGECPADSPITYFTVDPTILSDGQPSSTAWVSRNACQSDGTCDARLAEWTSRGWIKQAQAKWRCAGGAPSCDGDRFELRTGKEFYQATSKAVFLPLRNAVDEAFRYRTRFQNRSGTNLGFVPQICGQGQETLPYCYTPADIALLEQRHDCLLEIFTDHYEALSAEPALQSDLATAMREAFSDREDKSVAPSIFRPGFEKLRAELLVMLGDDAYVKALGSRFDLAGLGVANFQGTLLESGGLNLAGVAGAEMYNLYLATQYYQMVVERLGAQLGRVWRVVEEKNALFNPDIIGGPTVEEYLNRVIRASSQKARLFGEIAKRYQNLDRSDLARGVIERAYITGYMESMVMSTTMRTIAERTDLASVPQVRQAVSQAQLTYRTGLSDMSEIFRGLQGEVNFFGFPPDYIPFPALEAQVGRDSAFDVAIARAKERLALAQQAEDAGLASTRSFDTDAVSFQNELARVANTYEAQLSEVCGTFSAGGVVYPAIARYAYLDPTARLFGDPCGKMGTGQINDAGLEVRAQATEMQRVKVSMTNTLAEAEIERQRIAAACNTTAVWENAVVTLKDKQLTVSDEIRDFQFTIGTIDKAANAIVQAASVTPGVQTAIVGSTLALSGAATSTLTYLQQQKEHDLQELQNGEATLQFKAMCNDTGSGLLQVDSAARVQTIMLRMAELQVEAARAQIQMAQALSKLQQLVNQSRRVQAQMDENLQLTIDEAAARNDPNVRIYRNDAVIQADVTFNLALQEAYRATRVYEYYTSQTYPDRDKLFLSRMVTRGDFNLQDYLLGLEDSFRSFEDTLGVPDLRVLVLSLRDDLLKVPYTTECGAAVSTADRVALMQKRLSDPAALDSNGYVVVPFRLGPEAVSPLTRDHKLRFLEAQIVGGNGDQVGRVYVRSAGTSMVSTLDDELTFYTFPRRTGVINAFFSVKPPEYDPAVFRTNRFIDRPLMNSRWELVLNLKDEPANSDFGIRDINDIRLYLYYADFTSY